MKKVFICDKRESRVNYAAALEACGAVPVFSEDLSRALDCGGLLLPGGGDVDPALYGQEPDGSNAIDTAKDRQEIELIHKFHRAGKPILGICRGLQVLNVAFGGDLIQDIKTAPAHRWEESTGDKVHKVIVPRDSFLYPLYGETFFVNSAHHQAVKNPATGMTIAARAEDDVIEALENREKKIYAVQWHPERMAFRHARADTVDGQLIFAFFLGLCG